MIAVAGLTAALTPGTSIANTDVEPRLYSNVPVGVNFLGIGFARSRGDVTFDNSVPVEDVDGRVTQTVLSYSRGVNVLGRSGLVTLAIPYAETRLRGLYLGQPASGQVRGIGDPRIRVAVNLTGAPALGPEEFAAYRQDTIVGVNVTVVPPLGRYDSDRVLNVGTNRWSVFSQLGASHKRGRWTLESSVGVSWYSDNDELRGSNVLQQAMMAHYRGTVLYDLRPGMWLGAGLSYAYGGETTLNDRKRDDALSNWRAGVAISFALAPRQRLQIRATDGMDSRIGQDFRTLGVDYTLTF